jgi:hypothetical protein
MNKPNPQLQKEKPNSKEDGFTKLKLWVLFKDPEWFAER